MKRYKLICPKCNEAEEICADLADPEKIFCHACNEELDIDEIREFIHGWYEYLKDYDEMIKAEEENTKLDKNPC